MKPLNFSNHLWLVFAGFSLTALAAPQTIGTKRSDGTKNRVIPIRVRVPDGGGKTPLVIFSHGLGGSRDSGRVWGEH
jgi:predicted dienelactone hydrolase